MLPTFHVMIADDHPLYLEALVNGLVSHLPGTQVSQANNYVELFDSLYQKVQEIDLLIMDLFMPGSSGYAGLSFLRTQFPTLPIVVISALDDLTARSQCIQHGAAFISKSAPPANIFKQVEQILDGSYQFPLTKIQSSLETSNAKKIKTLTPSQFRVLHLIAAGHSNKTIADNLNISEKTVKAHISVIFEKLDVKNRTQAALLLTENIQ